MLIKIKRDGVVAAGVRRCLDESYRVHKLSEFGHNKLAIRVVSFLIDAESLLSRVNMVWKLLSLASSLEPKVDVFH